MCIWNESLSCLATQIVASLPVYLYKSPSLNHLLHETSKRNLQYWKHLRIAKSTLSELGNH